MYVFFIYKLKPGVNIEDYRKFSQDLDQKITPHQPGIKRFEVYEVKGKVDGDSPFKIVEFAEVESLEAWKEFPKQEAMKEVVERWKELCDDQGSLTIYAEKIEPR